MGAYSDETFGLVCCSFPGTIQKAWRARLVVITLYYTMLRFLHIRICVVPDDFGGYIHD